MTDVTAHTKDSHGLADLREQHQSLALRSAATGIVPEVFEGDPTFLDLVSSKDNGDGGNRSSRG